MTNCKIVVFFKETVTEQDLNLSPVSLPCKCHTMSGQKSFQVQQHNNFLLSYLALQSVHVSL